MYVIGSVVITGVCEVGCGGVSPALVFTALISGLVGSDPNCLVLRCIDLTIIILVAL